MQVLRKIMGFTAGLMAKKVLPWAHEIQAMPDLIAIEYATKRLTENLNSGIFDNHQYIEAFFSIDAETHALVERVSAEYLESDHIDLDYESYVAQVVYLYHRQIYNTHLKLIRNPAPAEPQVLLTMLLRATNSAIEMIKWRYYQFQSAPTNIWLQLAKLYSIAEENALLNESMPLYADLNDVNLNDASTDADKSTQKLTTMTAAYLQACMLGSLETLSFKPQQIALTCKIIDTWSANLTIDKEYDTLTHSFYIDLNQNKPAKRIRNYKPSETHRYWSLDVINSKIELGLSLLEFNIAPKQAKIIEITQQKYALITLSALRAEWSRVDASRQRRSVERTSTSKNANITFGFESTCNRIHQDESALKKIRTTKTANTEKSDTDTSLANDQDQSNVIYVDLDTSALSTIVDESNKGVGLQVRKQANEVSIGMLVSIVDLGKNHGHKVGVIRNIKPIAGNQLHIGLELLSRAVFCIEAENISSQLENTTMANEFSDTAGNFSHDSTRFSCLYLPKAFSNSTEDTLIISRHQYNKKNLYSINISGKKISIKLNEVVAQHENWLRVTYQETTEK